MNKKELSKIIIEHLSRDKKFHEILPLVQANTTGKIWLVGSTLYRTLTHKLYGGTSHIKDYDFLVEKLKTPFIAPADWTLTYSRYGNPKLKQEKLAVDIFPLTNMLALQRKNLPPRIEHYLTCTPFTIQSIAFDLETRELIGEIGIKSILTKTVGINCKDEYEDAYIRYGDPAYGPKKYAQGLDFKEI